MPEEASERRACGLFHFRLRLSISEVTGLARGLEKLIAFMKKVWKNPAIVIIETISLSYEFFTCSEAPRRFFIAVL